MRYQEHPKFTKGFIVMRCSGFGVMEANYEDEEVMFETDSMEEAYAEADRLLHANNSEETIKSSWIPNTYWVHANTSTEIGKAEYDKFRAESDETIRIAKEEGRYRVVRAGETMEGFPVPKITGRIMKQIIWNGKNWDKQ